MEEGWQNSVALTVGFNRVFCIFTEIGDAGIYLCWHFIYFVGSLGAGYTIISIYMIATDGTTKHMNDFLFSFSFILIVFTLFYMRRLLYVTGGNAKVIWDSSQKRVVLVQYEISKLLLYLPLCKVMCMCQSVLELIQLDRENRPSDGKLSLMLGAPQHS